MLVAFSVAPSGGADGSDSLHDAVAAAVQVVRDSGLPNRTDAMFTTVEGEWDEVFDVIRRATPRPWRLRFAGFARAQGRHPAGTLGGAHRQGRAARARARGGGRRSPPGLIPGGDPAGVPLEAAQRPRGPSDSMRMPSSIARLRSATFVPTSKPATRYFSRMRLR